MIHAFTISIILVALIIGSITDLKKREVADWLNYSLIALGVGINLIYSLINWNFIPILESFAGLTLFFLLALLLFYTGQWGGGDSKMIIGLAAMIGLSFTISPSPFLINFILYSFLCGAVYGIIWSMVLAIKNWESFKKNVDLILNKKELKLIRTVAILFVMGLILLGIFSKAPFIRLFSFFFSVFIIFFFYVGVFMKAIENGCMIVNMKIEDLTEGEWIFEDVVIKGKTICGPKDLGIEKPQIEELMKYKAKGLIKTVKVKVGIPFVPCFLMGFLMALLLGGVENYVKLLFLR